MPWSLQRMVESFCPLESKEAHAWRYDLCHMTCVQKWAVIWKSGWLIEFCGTCPFLYYYLQSSVQIKSYTPNHKQGGLSSKDIEGTIRRETAASTMLLDSRVKPSLFWHGHVHSCFMARKKNKARKRNMWAKRHGVPNPEMPGDDKQADTSWKEDKVSEEMSPWRIPQRIPWNNY